MIQFAANDGFGPFPTKENVFLLLLERTLKISNQDVRNRVRYHGSLANDIMSPISGRPLKASTQSARSHTFHHTSAHVVNNTRHKQDAETVASHFPWNHSKNIAYIPPENVFVCVAKMND